MRCVLCWTGHDKSKKIDNTALKLVHVRYMKRILWLCLADRIMNILTKKGG